MATFPQLFEGAGVETVNVQGQFDISKRQAEIADLVQTAGFASVEDLAERFEVTTQTIRRDVNGLCELGILRRTHGGVEAPVQAQNIHYSTRKILNFSEKEKVADLVASHVENGQSLAFSIGTTPEIVLQALVNHTDLRIFTNNLNVAFTASNNATFQVTIAGGRLRHGDKDVLGASVGQFFGNYKVDIGIFGVAGVDEEGTLLDFHEDEVAAREAILANCRKSFLVLDHSKFGREAYVRGGNIADVSAVFCDRPLPEALRDTLQARNVEIFTPGADA